MPLVVAEKKLDSCFSAVQNSCGVGGDFHAFRYGIYAGSDKALCALYFYNAYTAGADSVDVLEVAKSGYLDAQSSCRFKYCGAFGYCDRFSVYFKINHRFLLTIP